MLPHKQSTVSSWGTQKYARITPPLNDCAVKVPRRERLHFFQPLKESSTALQKHCFRVQDVSLRLIYSNDISVCRVTGV